MRVLIAFDKFKDALTARQACDIAARALRGRHPDWHLDLCPMADGGEGFAEILARAAGGQVSTLSVAGPRGGLVEAPLGLVPFSRIPETARARLGLGHLPPDRKIAVVEMAAASGLALLPDNQRDPWQATSQGTGQLIRSAAESGAAAVLLGIGGSATHDLGLGALDALGLEFRADDGRRFRPPLPAHWPQIARIEGEVFASIPPLRVACDVSNPLLGPRGAAAVYAPQKGLRLEDLGRMEAEHGAHGGAALRPLRQGERISAETPGAGAAGGFSFGLMVAAGGEDPAGIFSGHGLARPRHPAGGGRPCPDRRGAVRPEFAGGQGPGCRRRPGARARQAGPCVCGPGDGAAAGARPGLGLHAITPAGTPLAEALRDCLGEPGRRRAARRARSDFRHRPFRRMLATPSIFVGARSSPWRPASAAATRTRSPRRPRRLRPRDGARGRRPGPSRSRRSRRPAMSASASTSSRRETSCRSRASGSGCSPIRRAWTAAGRATVDILRRAPGVHLVALFATEHGIYGTSPAGKIFPDRVDPRDRPRGVLPLQRPDAPADQGAAAGHRRPRRGPPGHRRAQLHLRRRHEAGDGGLLREQRRGDRPGPAQPAGRPQGRTVRCSIRSGWAPHW